MPVNAPQNITFDFSQLNVTTTTPSATDTTAADSFAVQFSQVKTEMFSTLVSSAFGDNTGANAQNSSNDPLGTASNGLSSSGYNMSLFDPQSAYNMMTGINNDQVQFKAQYADLSQMGTAVQGMQQDATSLGGISASTGDSSITSQLQQFVGQYNAWVTQFNGDMSQGGVLSGMQAAQESRYELAQSVQSVFNGGQDRIHGLGDIGLTIDPSTGLASLDTSKLNSMLASNKQGVVDTVDQFSSNFSKSAQLLNESNNFIPSELANLNNAISYINTNLSSLQAEFGTGAPATPTGSVAQALASYNSIAKA